MKIHNIFLALVLICVFSCGKKSNLTFHKRDQSHYNQIINQVEMPTNPSSSGAKLISLDHYPMDLKLFKNGSFYYSLTNYDDGVGNWKYENGKLVLHAIRRLFDMHIEIFSTEANGNGMVVTFSDRDGYQEHPINLIEE